MTPDELNARHRAKIILMNLGWLGRNVFQRRRAAHWRKVERTGVYEPYTPLDLSWLYLGLIILILCGLVLS